MEPELVRSFSACLKSMRTWFDSTRFHLYRDTKTVSYSGVAFTCAGKSAERVSKTKQGRKKQALPSPVCRHGEIGDRAALPTRRMRVRTPLSAYHHVISRFSSAERASALQAEGPRFDPWNREEGSFPVRLGSQPRKQGGRKGSN